MDGYIDSLYFEATRIEAKKLVEIDVFTKT